MIDFPATPSVGSVFSDGSGRSWTWDGVKWTAAVATGGAYVAKTGDTMSGPLLLSGDPSQALGAATKQYVDANYSGFVNKFRNATFDIWQRGTSFNIPVNTLVYAADGWSAACLGAAQVAGQQPGRGPTLNAMYIQGAAGVTVTILRHRIESYIAAPLGGNAPVTFQLQLYNNTGAAITPTLGVVHATAQDNFTSVATDVATVNLQSCPQAAWTRLAYTFTVPQASANLGLEIQVNFGATLSTTAKAVAMTEADIRVTPGWPVGLCANPPLPELRPIGQSLIECERYYQRLQGVLVTGNAGAGQAVYQPFPLPVTMRAAPASGNVAYTSISYSNASAIAFNQATQNMLVNQCAITAAGYGWAGGLASISMEL